ncbi:hypothetical protein XA68_16909 [Ophiocordyceps unilateralis]|uniref:Ubiquitin-like domain-containing protein n=1 Tax=Ophiocordyceps unilateralis TaxID=268505 RepID=A0A2A9P5G7_OPHUN|nr:hypothetical protein XA68_16909 [Ophiocordyceps unilateralis]
MATSDPSRSHAAEAVAYSAEHFVNLQVVSPSVGVNRPLLFPDLPASTTIKQLKRQIRQTLPFRPTDENQRLIHRGRALLRDSDSLLDIFGADALRTLERQTIHLVIRDVVDHQQAWTPSTTTRGASPAGSSHAARPTTSSHAAFGSEPPPGLPGRNPLHTASHPISQPRMPSPAPSPAPANQATTSQHQHQHQNMTNWLGGVQRDDQLQREAMVRALVHENQRAREWMAVNGIGDPPAEPSRGRASPGTGHSIHDETLGPNGRAHRVETTVRTAHGTSAELFPWETPEVRRREAEVDEAARALAEHLEEIGLGPVDPRRPLNDRVLRSLTGRSPAGSGRSTPDVDSRSDTGAGNMHLTSQPQVYYLLSSPEGPQALLISSSVSDSYHSPSGPQTNIARLRSNASQPNAAVRAHTPREDQQPQPGEEAADAAPAQHPVPPVHPNNPPAAAVPPLVIQLWPHVWLIFRLGLFVWFFTSPNSSWSRWLTIIGLAVLVFVMSTGLLNGMAENVWRPIGRHLENILPALEQPRHGRAAGAGQGGEAARRAGPEDGSGPQQMAARLVAEHHARPGWLVGQFRRLERAGLLFLASLAPGVAERHIANLEAEAQAEEARRREAAEAAAAEANGASAGDDSASHETMVGDMESPQQAEQQGDDERQEDGHYHAMHEANREEVAAL